jgi:hypothetical protein
MLKQGQLATNALHGRGGHEKVRAIDGSIEAEAGVRASATKAAGQKHHHHS